MRLARVELRNFRNIEQAAFDASPGLNLFVGENAQGKTSLLEAIGLIARARSFRTEETQSLIRRGAEGLCARGVTAAEDGGLALEVELRPGQRRLRLDGREVSPARYHGRLDVVVYATERLAVVRGPMRQRRAFLDRGAAALQPAYRQALRDYERVQRQRGAALARRGRDLESWDERLIATGAALRLRRGEYARRLAAALAGSFRPRGEHYELALEPMPRSEHEARDAIRRELEGRRGDELRAARCLVGPHRDRVILRLDGEQVGPGVSSGQARSLLLALTLASLELYREERGSPALALLDDLDSELDEARARALCEEMARRGQAFVTTAHPGWVARLNGSCRRFRVAGGRVTPAA